MSFTLGIRREDKNEWEKRVPLIPQHLKELKENHDIDSIVQTSPNRIFLDKEFITNGIKVQEDLSSCPVVFAVKEIPIDVLELNKTYAFFSHTIKGQKYNMSMLKKMMELKCTLIDYEKIVDEKNRRLVFFGRFAGLAGMVDTLWAFGQRLKWQNIKSPFNEIKQTIHYNGLDEIKEHMKKIGKEIEQNGLSESINPVVIGFAGYGNVSQGAQEILDLLPVKEIRPNQIEAIHETASNQIIYKVVFKEEDMVDPVSSETKFNLQEYYNYPHLYRSIFQQYIHRLTIVMNCIYWDEKYPRLVTKNFLEENYTRFMKLQAIGDISVDINGAIEFTEKTTSPGNPVYVYNPIRDDIIDGYKGHGVVVMAVDNLPCELPRESSNEFSDSLIHFVPYIVKANYNVEFNSLDLPSEIKNAVILHRGELTPNYLYINNYL